MIKKFKIPTHHNHTPTGTDNALVFIADMQGSLMYQGYEHSIDISRWQTGMYCARIPATGQKALFMVVR
jgi:hypothetical protein